MTEKLQVYKCEKCGNMVEMLHAGPGSLVCCGAPMVLKTENSTDAAQEKHVPVIEKIETGFKVTVGSIAHPMADDHFIEWIELMADGQIHRQDLKPGAAPEAVFAVSADTASARAWCNLHGLWKGDL